MRISDWSSDVCSSDLPTYGMPVFSLYGEVRRPTGQSMHMFDVMLVDLQDLGCRIYTYVTTLLYMLEAAAQHGKAVRSEERRGGNECVRTCSSRGSPYH